MGKALWGNSGLWIQNKPGTGVGGEVRYLNAIVGREHSLYKESGAGREGRLSPGGVVWKH